MLPILTPAESSGLDRAAASAGITVDALMENAGRALAEAVRTLLGGAYGRRAVVVCGKGNNGGDGLVAARLLEGWGMGATAVLMSAPAALTGAARRSYDRFSSGGGRWLAFSPEGLAGELRRAGAAVDAVFGTGFRGSPEGAFAQAIGTMNEASCPVVSADIPSGVDGETGGVAGDAVRASATVAFGVLKPGVVFHPGAAYAGRVEVADIGLPSDLLRSDLWLVEPEDAGSLWIPRAPDTHKRATGTVVVLGGSRTMTGAPALAAAAAYRAGAGLVILAVPEGILPAVQGAGLEPTYLPLPQTDDGGVSVEAWPALRERLETADAVAVGPGLGRTPSTLELVRRVVAESPLPVVLDADGLFAFSPGGPLLAERRSALVVTPHIGEFAGLTGLSAHDVAGDRVTHARRAAAEFRCPVLLKGARTLVAEPDGRVRVNPTGGSFLATAGTGDVLAGAVSAFLARGIPPADALVLAAYVHGLAGELAASRLGEGTTASDVLGHLPVALARSSGRR